MEKFYNLALLYNQKGTANLMPAAGTLALTQILLSTAWALTIVHPIDVFWKSSQGHNINPCSSFHLGLPFQTLEGPLRAGTFARQTGATPSS